MSSSDAALAALLGPDAGSYYASMVRRVLELAMDPGHPDPRHSEFWWRWQDWPMDGRQWGREDGSYQLDRGAVSEHKRRSSMEGALGSKLKVERKLEGIIWDHDHPRTVLRSTGVFGQDMIEPLSDADDSGSEDQDTPWFLSAVVATTVSERRAQWDASVSPKAGTMRIKVSETEEEESETEQQFAMADPFRPFLSHIRSNIPPETAEEIEEHDTTMLLDAKIYFCTDAFATRAEQKAIQNGTSDERGTPSLSIHAAFTYFDTSTEDFATVHVIAEAPIAIFKDQLLNRVAGFVFQEETEGEIPVAHNSDSTPEKAVRITYVEACDCDYEPLTDSQKDALLEDRALIVHRLAEAVALQKGTISPLTARTPPLGCKEAVGLPPVRALKCYRRVGRPDPRWPLLAPNSVCLECGKGPKHPDEKQRVATLMECSKCRERKFCSKECLQKSWKSTIYPHKYECKKAVEDDQLMVGVSLREAFQGLANELDPDNVEVAEKIIETAFQGEDLDTKAENLEELQSQRKLDDKQKRRNARKRKKGKKRK